LIHPWDTHLPVGHTRACKQSKDRFFSGATGIAFLSHHGKDSDTTRRLARLGIKRAALTEDQSTAKGKRRSF
jgi:hypothetical protein